MRSFRNCRNGSVGVIVALMALPLIVITGCLGIDYSFLILTRSQLNAAADSAAIQAVNNTVQAIQTNASDYIAQGVQAGTRTFNAKTVNIDNVTVGNVAVTVTYGATVVSNVNYTATYNTVFGKLVGVPTVNISNTVASVKTVSGYSDFHIVMDTSGSMSIAATPTDIANFAALIQTSKYKNLPLGQGGVQNAGVCAFACHVSPTNDDLWGLAQKNGIMTRAAVQQSAVSQMLLQMQQMDINNKYRAAVYGFDTDATTVYSLSTDISGAAAAAANMQQPLIPVVNSQPATGTNTYFGKSLATINNSIPTPGNGATQSSANEFLFLVTDGLGDMTVGGKQVVGPITAADCQPLKDKGVKILILYVQYMPMDTVYGSMNLSNSFYVSEGAQSQVDPYGSETNGTIANVNDTPVVQGLNACLSSEVAPLFYANDSSQIATQLQKMFAAAAGIGAKLTK